MLGVDQRAGLVAGGQRHHHAKTVDLGMADDGSDPVCDLQRDVEIPGAGHAPAEADEGIDPGRIRLGKTEPELAGRDEFAQREMARGKAVDGSGSVAPVWRAMKSDAASRAASASARRSR